MSIENLDQQIVEEERKLRGLRAKRDMDLQIRRRGARIIEVENDFFVKALPTIFQARVHKLWLANVEDLDKQIDEAAAETKLAVQDEARRIWRGELDEKDGKKTIREYVKIDDIPALIQSIMVAPSPPKPQYQRLDFGQFLKTLISACYKVDLWASKMKNLVRQQASELIAKAPTLYTNILHKMAEDSEFRRLIFSTPDREKALILQKLIQEIKGETGERAEEKAETVEQEKVPTAQEIFNKMKGYAR